MYSDGMTGSYSCRQLSGALLVITTILAWSLSTAYAAPIDQARRTYLAGDYDEAMRLMTPLDRKSTRLNSSHSQQSRMPSSA